MNPIHFSHHEGISCDHCMKSNFRGKRFKCLVCPDYDLCSACYESGTVPAGKQHTSEHAVQCILTRNDYEIYFGGEPNPVEQVQSFTCPICGKMGFTETLLYDHSVQEHSDTLTEVACPICCSMLNNEQPSFISEDLTSHLSIEHRSERVYETPQASRGRRAPTGNRSGTLSQARNGNLNQTRNRRQIPPSAVTMLSNINPLLSALPHDHGSATAVGTSSNSQINQIRDLDPISELLSQLRRSQNVNQNSLSSNTFTNPNLNPLHLHLERNTFRSNTLRQVFERSTNDIAARRHNNQSSSLNQPPLPPASQSNLNSNGVSLSFLLMDAPNNQTAVGQTVASNSTTNSQQSLCNQFLLPTCKEKSNLSKELEDAQKVEKSLFLQELLISSIENFFKYDFKFQKKKVVKDDKCHESQPVSDKKSEDNTHCENEKETSEKSTNDDDVVVVVGQTDSMEMKSNNENHSNDRSTISESSKDSMVDNCDRVETTCEQIKQRSCENSSATCKQQLESEPQSNEPKNDEKATN